MYRITELGGKFYAKEIDLYDEDDIEDLKSLVEEGNDTILCQDLEDFDEEIILV